GGGWWRAVGSRAGGGVWGGARVPGEKSISHRSMMLGSLAVGETVIEGLLEGEDVLRTAAAMRALGASAVREANGTWRVRGRGIGGPPGAGGGAALGQGGPRPPRPGGGRCPPPQARLRRPR